MPLSWIALNTVKGLGPVRISKLIERYGSADEVFKQPLHGLINSGQIPEECAKRLADTSLFIEAEKQLSLAEKLNVRILSLASKEYPVYLREIFAPPPVLYIRGNLSLFSLHAIGMVGTRNPTPYGRQSAARITRELVEHNLVITSGLALGIDTIVHQTCLDAAGKTVAVLGCGIDRLYPRSNSVLGEKIIEQGALVSEFPIGTPPEPFNFPRRNRIISGLSAGVVVVEGGERSGSLITANYALAQGREVFAVPGPINSPQSQGTFNLIREGATPCRSGHEIAENLPMIKHPYLGCAMPAGLAFKIPETMLSEAEKKIYQQLGDVPRRIDELAELTKQNIASLFDSLLNLELKGMIKQLSGQLFVRS